MKSFLVLAPLLLALSATSMFILLPLHEYPGTSASAWSNVTAAIAAYPKVQWQVIINPDSGPGTNLTNPYPTDPGYIAGISKLNSYPDVITLGYVDTSFTKTPYSTVISNISVYAEWASYTKANISIGGIFFDDVNDTDSATVSNYYGNASAYAYANVPSAVTPVIFNPGNPGPTKLFDHCDTMVEFEDLVSKYQNVPTIDNLPSEYLDQSAIILYNTTAATDIESLVHSMSQNGIEAVYFDYGSCTYNDEPTGCYNHTSLTNLKKLAAAVMAG